MLFRYVVWICYLLFVFVLLFLAFPCFALLLCGFSCLSCSFVLVLLSLHVLCFSLLLCDFSCCCCFSCFFSACFGLSGFSPAFLYFPASCPLVAYCFPVLISVTYFLWPLLLLPFICCIPACLVIHTFPSLVVCFLLYWLLCFDSP